MNSTQEYQNWLALTAGNAQEQEELRALASDPAELEDRFYRELSFGTAGMRGVLGLGPNRMNRYTVGRVTLALAALVNEHEGGAGRGVAIGYDSRNFSQEFARETALILASQGVKAYLFDSLRPVPVLSFTVRHLHCLAGVVITASHNPSKYNGYKVYWEDGGQLPPDRAAIITGRLDGIGYGDAKPMDEKEAREKGLLVTIPAEVDDAYIAAVKKLAVNPELTREMGKTLKIVYTPLHGSGNIPVRRVLKEIGVENVFVVPEQELPNGNFPTVRVPNPEEKDAFDLAVAMQKKLGADLCVGTDPDCDRVGVACLTALGRCAPAHRQPDRLHPPALHPLAEKGAGDAAEKCRGGQVHRLHGNGARHLPEVRYGTVRRAHGLQVHRREDPAVRGDGLQHLRVRL